MALELHRSCASSSRVEWSTHHRGAMHGELLNPAWTRHLPCKYGELPGMWLPYMGPTIQDFNNLQDLATILGLLLRLTRVTVC